MGPTRSSLNGIEADDTYERWHPKDRLHRILSWSFWGVLTTAVVGWWAVWYPIYNADETRHHEESQANRDRITKLEIEMVNLKVDNDRLHHQYEIGIITLQSQVAALQATLTIHLNERPR